MAKYVSEFLGTAILLFVVVGSGIMGENLNSSVQVTLLTNTLATVFALYFLISSLQPFSTHFNPVVSFVFCLKGEISVKTCTGFVALQIAGAICGVMLANYLFGIDPVDFSEKTRSGTNIFVSEVFATFGLLLVILLSTKEKVAVEWSPISGRRTGLPPRLPLPTPRGRSGGPSRIPLPESTPTA